jgi:hypothetical protein
VYVSKYVESWLHPPNLIEEANASKSKVQMV